MSTSFKKQDNSVVDNELVFRINAGEYELFYTLLMKYSGYINFTAKKLSVPDCDFEDLIQEGTIALFSAVKTFVSDRSDFFTYASHCIKNAMIDVLRKASAKNKIPDSLLSSLEDIELKDNNTPEKIFFENEDYRLLADSIKIELSKTEYDVLNYFLSGLSYSEIALKLKISVKAVDNSLQRVRLKLKNKRI